MAVDDKGAPLTPQPKVIFNYDGTATVISGDNVVVWGQDGNFKSKYTAVAPDTVNPDGSITKGDGTIVNPDGSTKRTPVQLPGHKTLDPNGGEDKGRGKDGTTTTGGQTQPGTEKTGPTCGAVLADGTKVCPPAGSADASTSGTTGTSTSGTATAGGDATTGTGSTSGSGSTTGGSSTGGSSTGGSASTGSSN